MMMGGVAAFAGEFGDDEGVGFGDGVGKALNDDLFEVGGGWGESYWAGGGFGDMVDKGEEGGGECSEAVGSEDGEFGVLVAGEGCVFGAFLLFGVG